MQEAIEYLKLFNLKASAIILEDKFLEKEKEQIENAFDTGCTDENRIGKEYYNETYNK